MTKLEYLLMYQKADLKKQQLENSLRTTESRQKLNKITKLLREQQATIQKLTEDADGQQTALGKLLAQQESLSHELELNHSEMETLEADEEVTAEELTEFRTDVERLNRELGRLEKDVRSLLDQLEKTSADFQKARSLGAKAKKEYDRLKAVVEVEKTPRRWRPWSGRLTPPSSPNINEHESITACRLSRWSTKNAAAATCRSPWPSSRS